MMSVIRMYVFLFELFLAAICLLFFKEFETIITSNFGYGDKVMYSICGSIFSHAFYLALGMISRNLKTEYSTLKESLNTFVESTGTRFDLVETKNDLNSNSIDVLRKEMSGLNSSMKTIKIDISNINKHLQRKREIEVSKKEFKQELDAIWRDYSSVFDKDCELKDFSSMFYRKMIDFMVEKHKYDFTDINMEDFILSHKSIIEEVKRISITFAINNVFLDSFFGFINTINKKYYADCERNFDSELNSKRKKFETDSSRYMLNLLDCIQLVWKDFQNHKKEKTMTITAMAEDI